MKTLLKISLLFCFSLLIVSCNKYSEIHEVSFVISMGLDYDEEEKMYEVLIYVINNANLTQSDNQSTDASSYIGVYRDHSITEALKKITSNVDLTLEFKHVKTVFINERFLTYDNREYFYTFFKNGPLLYPSFEIYITPDPIKDIYNVQVFEETTLFYTILTGNKKAHSHKPITFYEFVNDLLIPNYYLGYPVISVSSDIFQNGQEEFYKTENIGVMYFTENAEKTFFNYDDYPGMYLINDFNNLLLKLKDIEILIDNYQFEYKVTKDQKIIFNINLELNYIYSKLYNLYNYKDYISKYIQEEIKKLYLYCVNENIDIFNINYLRSLKRLPDIDLNKIQFEYNINFVTT